MKTIFVFALVLSVYTLNAQIVDCVKEVNFENKGSVLFPVVKNLEGSANINKYLLDYLKNAFYIKSEKTLIQSLDEAKFKGLDSLSYLVFETDSTISFALTFALRRVDMHTDWVEFLTFCKQTGKRIQLFEIFPDIDICKISNTLITLIRKHKYELSFLIKNLYNENKISKEEYTYVDFIFRNLFVGSTNDKYNFMLWKNHLYIKNGILFPQSVNKLINNFFIIDVNEFRTRAQICDCF